MKKFSKILVVLLAIFVFAGCSLKKEDKKEEETKSTSETEVNTYNENNTSNNNNSNNNNNTSNGNSSSITGDDFIALFNEERKDASHIIKCEITEEGTNTYGEIIWDGNNVTKTVINVKIFIDNIEDYSEELFNQISTISLAAMNEQFGIDENTNGAAVTMDSNYNEATITFTVYVDFVKADQNVIDNLQMGVDPEDLVISVEEMKSDMEASGYTCTITK